MSSSLLALGLPVEGRAAVYTVTSAADNGPGTLRQAITDANANSGADSIVFDSSVTSITLWNTVRTPEEIRANMLTPLAGSESGLLAYYKFDSMEDLAVNADGVDDLRDSSSNAYHADTEAAPLPVPNDLASRYYVVPVTASSGKGMVQVDLMDDDSIVDGEGDTLGTTGAGNGALSGSGSLFQASFDLPTASITRSGSSPTNGTTAVYTATFTEPVAPVVAGDLTLAAAGVTGPTLVSVDSAFGKALALNATLQTVNVPGFGNVAPTSEITIEFWLLANRRAQQQTFMLSPDDNADRIYRRRHDGGSERQRHHRHQRRRHRDGRCRQPLRGRDVEPLHHRQPVGRGRLGDPGLSGRRRGEVPR